MRLILNRWLAVLALVVGVEASPAIHAFTTKDLLADAKLTPDALIRKFAKFKFKLIDGVQPREEFLASQTGDCDDFATLAADVLAQKGYRTQLVAVFMEQQVHVVCYVADTKTYLDYNNRSLASPLVATNGSLTDIAGKVAKSFHAGWRCVSEYTFKNGVQRTTKTEFSL
ncbi:MAG: hypothetical protein JWR26_4155 [Pedosphaera sp.]|nr:hypothetical protein [Pedosphaera sp.]